MDDSRFRANETPGQARRGRLGLLPTLLLRRRGFGRAVFGVALAAGRALARRRAAGFGIGGRRGGRGRFLGRGGGGRLGRLLGRLGGVVLLLAFHRPQSGDALLVRLVILGEGMSAGAIRDEIEVARARRIGHRLQRGAAGIGDGARRQAGDHIGVVRRGLRDLAAPDRPAERAPPAHEAVDDGGVGLQLHLQAQPVDEHGGDAAALVGAAGFLLDDRGERDELLGRLDRNVGRAPLPHLVDDATLRLLHALDDLIARGAARKLVGLRQQRALARHVLHRPGEDVVLHQPRDDLLRGQPFGNGERVLHHLAVDQRIDNVAQARRFGEGVFARLQVGARLHREHAGEERPAIVLDHAVALQNLGDVAHPRLGNVDDLFLGQRPRRIEPLLDVEVAAAGRDHGDEDQREDGVADDDDRIARTRRTLRRRRHTFGLKRRARASRRNGPLTHRCNPMSFRFRRCRSCGRSSSMFAQSRYERYFRNCRPIRRNGDDPEGSCLSR